MLRSLGNEAEPVPALVRLRVRALLGVAMAQWEATGDMTSALGIVAEAEKIIDTADAQDLAAAARGQRGLLQLRSGDVGAALAALDQAADLLDLAEPMDQMTILLNRGVLHLERFALKSAAADLERCRSIAEASGSAVLAFKATHNLGYVEFLAGRIPRALAALEAAEQQNVGDPHPVSYLDRARVYREAGLTREADALLEKAAALFRQQRLFQDLGENELVRSECALVEGDPRRAAAFAASAYRRFVRRGNVRWQRNAELQRLRCDRLAADGKRGLVQRNALNGIAVRARTLAEASRNEHRPDIARSAELVEAEVLLRLGAAIPADYRVRASDSLQTRLQTREVRTLAFLASNQNRRAASEVRRGLVELGSYQNRFGSLDLRTASAVHGVQLSKLQLDLAMADGRPSAVFAGIERARAVSTRLAQVRPPSDEQTAELLAELRQVEEEARGMAGDAGGAETLVRLRTRAAHLQRDIRARAWEIEADHDGPVQASARLAPVRAAAGESAFATYARHHGRWIAVVSVGRRVALHHLASVTHVDELVRRVRADLDAIAMPRLPEPIVTAIRGSIESALERLDDLLVRPLRIGRRSLVVSCSGSLVVMPWSLVPSRFGLPTVVTPSATSWLRSQGHPRPEAPDVVSIGGPDLHLAAVEATRVGAVWTSSRIVTGEAATIAVAHEALNSAHVVHIAAHGTHRQDSPLFSSIRLADGQLYAYELDADSHIAPFVALSACDAGLATVRPGEEGLGMTNALLQLGTRSVLAGVARVRDDIAAEVMQRVHDGLASGMDSAGALAAAQADCVDAGVPVPFITFGCAW